jgi:hypothetical protein
MSPKRLSLIEGRWVWASTCEGRHSWTAPMCALASCVQGRRSTVSWSHHHLHHSSRSAKSYLSAISKLHKLSKWKNVCAANNVLINLAQSIIKFYKLRELGPSLQGQIYGGGTCFDSADNSCQQNLTLELFWTHMLQLMLSCAWNKTHEFHLTNLLRKASYSWMKDIWVLP